MALSDDLIRFLERLPITAGAHAGRPLVLRPWQKDILHRIYAPGVRDAVISMPRKQGKSTLVSALVLAHLCGPVSIARGQIVSCASDKQQASIIWNEAKAMLEATPALERRLQVYETTRRIVDPVSGSVYMAVASTGHRLHGLSPSLVVFDELAQTQGRRMYEALRTASGAHASPLRLVISTCAVDPTHPMAELEHYGRQVNEGILADPSFCYVNFSAPLDADPWDEATWYAANPALNDFRSLEELHNLAEKARHIPTLEAMFRRYYLNQPIDTATEGLCTPGDWDACSAVPDPSGPCYAGLDLSSSRDMTAVVLFWPSTGAVLPYFWLPGEGLHERAEADRAPYVVWRDQGLLRTTPGRTIDKKAVVRLVVELSTRYQIEKIGYDRWRIDELTTALDDEGVTLPLEPFGQGYKDMSPAVAELERLILAGDLAHGRHPVLRWQVSNTVLDMDPAGSRKPNKRKSRSRIDGVVALCMAVAMAARYRPAALVEPVAMWL